MKKIFTLIASAFIALSAVAQTTLIDYPASEAGISVEGTSAKGTVKIHTNNDAINSLQLRNGYSTDGAYNGNSIKLTTSGGFKAGDVLTIVGYINNADAAKRATAVLFTISDSKTTKLFQFKDFLNGNLVADDATPESYTLEADAAELYLGRDGNTGANVTEIKVVRAGGGDGPTPSGDKESMNVSSEAVQTLITNSIANPIMLSHENFFIVSKDSKIYPLDTQANGAKDVVPSDGTPVSLKTYIWEYTSGNVTLKAVSTPNDDAKPEEAWQNKITNENQKLNVSGCNPVYEAAYAPKNGNPTASYKDYYEYNKDGDAVHRVDDGPYWAPGAEWSPVKGCYYELNVKAAGQMKIALWLNACHSNPLYIFEKESRTLIPNDKISLIGFANNNTTEKDDAGNNAVVPFTLNSDFMVKKIDGSNPATKPFYGYFTFDLPVGSYIILSPKSQIGIFGYEFTTTSTGISDIVVEKAQNDAIYNIAGQRVSGSAKGLVIKNGKKYFVK